MNRFENTFTRLRAGNRKALIPFFTAGDPALEATVPVMHALVEAGADAIELGVAFSDPMADGPVIQRSSERALERGAGTGYVFDCVRRFRQRDADTPVVLMGYLNPVEVRGAAHFATEAVAAGRRPSAQAIEPWPATCMTPSPITAAQPPAVAGNMRSPKATAATSSSGALATLDQNMTRVAPTLRRAALMARK